MNEPILRPKAPLPLAPHPPSNGARAPGLLAAGAPGHAGPAGEQGGGLEVFVTWPPVRVASPLHGHDDDARLLGWSDGEPLVGWDDDATSTGVLLNVTVRPASPLVPLLGHDDDLPLRGWIDGAPLHGS